MHDASPSHARTVRSARAPGRIPSLRRCARSRVAAITGALLFASEHKRAMQAAEQGNVQAALQWLVQYG